MMANDEPLKCEHKTKSIQFLGRTTPIILQNENGPCPLLSICNVLLLKNDLNLNGDVGEVSQERLLTLVADRLIESNSNIDDKDPEYVGNQQQNISDAIDLLPRLATGIDVNLRFRRIDDFEFTPECAIFDLLDIPLYHGWIVDSQDYETANAIGTKSYNALTLDLVALEIQKKSEESTVDFAAATTATLGVPSPSLSRGISFDESPRSIPDLRKVGKGDVEEEAELFKALKISKVESPTSPDGPSSDSEYSKKPATIDLMATIDGDSGGENEKLHLPEPSVLNGCNASVLENNASSESLPAEVVSVLPKIDEKNHGNQPNIDVENTDNSGVVNRDTGESITCNDSVEKASVITLAKNESAPSASHGREDVLRGNEPGLDQLTSSSDMNLPMGSRTGIDPVELSDVSPRNTDSNSSSGRSHHDPDIFTSSGDSSEPMYEGEERIWDSGFTVYEKDEPMYEGEVVLAEQADKGNLETSTVRSSKEELTPCQGKLIGDFLNSNQLTMNGLFCLQYGLKERELCVFFRNNHFSTMFKYEGELYLLATDQGYMNEPDLVWEKLNEVNGNTLFVNGNFKESKLDSPTKDTWDEQKHMTSTSDYLASVGNSADLNEDFNSDLQLAMVLQEQEYQQQLQSHNSPPQSSTSSTSRLVTGPQIPRSRPTPVPPSKQDPKSKDKCIVM